jgi:hypothetical protein
MLVGGFLGVARVKEPERRKQATDNEQDLLI